MKKDKGFFITIIGVSIMFLLTLTKIFPSSSIAGFAVFVGIAFFFIFEGVTKTPANESGLQFKSIFKDLKKPKVIILVLLPIVSCVATMIIGNILFKEEFVNHVMSRTGSILSFDKIPLLVFEVIIAALGEEIAYRGFFVGKTMKYFPFWLCALVSSVLFASGHIAVGNFGLVFYDVATIFIDSLIYALLYKQSGNCLVSTISHILCNTVGIVATFIFF